jgi:hypothetical protein
LKTEWVRMVGMIPASSVDEALRIAKEGVESEGSCIFMPHGSFVLPIIRS